MPYQCPRCPDTFFHHFLNPCSCWLVMSDFLDILTFLRMANWISWLGWHSHPTAAQWGTDELSLSSAHRLCRDYYYYFSFAMLPPAVRISALKDNCHDSHWTPKEVYEIMKTRKFCGTDQTNICWELLRLHWTPLDVGGHWRPIVIQTMLSQVPFTFHFLRFPDTCIKIQSKEDQDNTENNKA